MGEVVHRAGAQLLEAESKRQPRGSIGIDVAPPPVHEHHRYRTVVEHLPQAVLGTTRVTSSSGCYADAAGHVNRLCHMTVSMVLMHDIV